MHQIYEEGTEGALSAEIPADCLVHRPRQDPYTATPKTLPGKSVVGHALLADTPFFL